MDVVSPVDEVYRQSDIDLIYRRLDAVTRGSGGDDQRRIALTGLEILYTLLRKNADYGSSVFKPPILAPTMEPGSAILVRLSDKICRLNNLLSGNSAEVAESIDDTLADLAGYAILYLARPKHDRGGADVVGSHGPEGLSAIDDAS